MRVIFVYTDSNAPSVSSVKNVTTIAEITESNVDKIQVTTANSQTYKFVKSQGQMSILWE